MTPRRLVTFVEGDGDVAAVPTLARRVLRTAGGTDALYVDPEPFRVRGLGTLVRDGYRDWHRWLEAAGLRTGPPLGAVLLVLDGEPDPVPPTWKTYAERYGTRAFCPVRVAAELAEGARAARGGSAFSVAVVLAVPEFEAWLLAGIEGLRGVRLDDRRGTIAVDANVDGLDVERARDAKRHLRQRVSAYSERLDQALLANHLDIERGCKRSRSLMRFQTAINQLVQAARDGQAIASPRLPAAS